MKKVEILLDSGEVLDLANEFGMGVNYSIEDIADPSKRNSSFTKTIILPGTKSNNKILGYLFDINSDFTYFNPNFKLDCKIVVDGTVILDGFLQLRKIDKQAEGDLIYYETVIYQEAVDFFSLMGEDFIADIDFSELDHVYSGADIGASWTNTYSDGYVYPLYYNNSNVYTTQDFKPAIFLRYYIDKIAQEHGFSLGGSFLDNTTFNSEIVPYNGGDIIVDDATLATRKFEARTPSSDQIDLWVNTYTDWSDNDSTFTLPLRELTDDSGTDISNVWNTTTNTWTINVTGQYTLPIQFGYKLDIGAAANTWLRSDSTGGIWAKPPIWIEVKAYKNGTQIGSTIKSVDNTLPNNTYDNRASKYPAFGSVNGTSHTKYFDVIGSLFEDEVLIIGDEITFVTYVRTTSGDEIYYANDTQAISGNPPRGYNHDTPASQSVSMDLWMEPTLEDGVTPTKINNLPTTSYLADYDNIAVNQFIPVKIKQKDLFSDLIKRYNLMITTDPSNNKRILLETRDDYYSDTTTILDWTDKKDMSFNDSIELLSELQNKKINFTYKMGKDGFSEQYFSSTRNIYGEKEIVYTNEFVKGTKKIESIFESTPLIYNSINEEIVVPMIDTKTPKSGIKVLQWGGIIDCLNNKDWIYNGYYANGTPIVATHSDYPYAGHWDDPFNPTTDNHFSSIINLANGESKTLERYSELSTSTNNNFYNKYWSNYINQIDDGKLVTMRLALSENDIASVKDDFATTIFIRDAYYLLNKIEDYDPTKESGLTIVKLLKTKGSIVFSPTINYSGTTGTVQVSQTGANRPAGNIEMGGQLLTAADRDSKVLSQHVSIVGESNIVYEDVKNVSIVGDSNIIENLVENSLIMGSNGSTITAGVNGSYIIGVNDKVITRDNEGWIGNLHIIEGTIVSEWNVIEGGQDVLGWPQLFATNDFNTIEGGDEELRDSNYTNIQNLVDGGFETV